MPSIKTSKIKRKAAGKAARHRQPATSHKKYPPQARAHRNLRPDIRGKKSSYSKSARQAVLASAEARTQLIEMGGENTIDIIREFDRDMSDEELARKTGIKASDVRVVLNRLHSIGLFSYTRVRDRDSGWYSYIWRMSEGRLREFAGEAAQPGTDSGQKEETIEGEDYLKKNIVHGAGEAQPQPPQQPSMLPQEKRRR
jgi:TFIIE alpha subunit